MRVLYERYLPTGPLVRILVTSEPGATPVIAVLEVDRRTTTARSRGGTPPRLIEVEASSELEALSLLEARAGNDDEIERLMRERVGTRNPGFGDY